MDLFTHLCLPLAVVFVYREDLASSTPALGLAAFALLPDLDKFVGMQGLLHSLVTLVPICVGIFLTERWNRGRVDLSLIMVALIASHLLLDFIDGGPVPLFHPLIEYGWGMTYPGQLVFGEGLVGVTLRGPLVALRTPIPRTGYQSFGFLDGTGVMSMIAFLSIYAHQRGWAPRTRRGSVRGRIGVGNDAEVEE